MDELTRARRHVEAAWRSFVVDGEITGSVRPAILRSWQRVRGDLGVDPALRTCPRALAPEDALARVHSEEAHLVASRLVSRFADRLAPDGHVVAYLDEAGVMLAIEGNHRTRSRLADVNFAPGACWAEGFAGTNGPGTALAETQAVEVFATEHFVEAWQSWNCASVPVRVGGRTVGVVDITSPWNARTPALLLTAEALAQAIASEVEASQARSERDLLVQVSREALRARDDVLAVASHELKTPLTPLRLKIQQIQRLLSRDAGHVDVDELATILRGADRYTGRLVRFLDDLLAMSRVVREPLRLALAPTDLVELVRKVIARNEPDLAALGCDVRVSAPSPIVGQWDAAHLERAVEQLLVNAMKYAPGRIDIAVALEAAAACVWVRDHGPGIASEDRDRVFLPYERAVSCCHASGFGLGLHAVRRIAEAHGGAVHLTSELGRGSTFVLELPLGRGVPAPV